MFVSVTGLLDELRGVLDRLGSVDWPACDPGAVAVSAVELARGADRLEAISLLAVAEHDRRGGVQRDGDGSLGDWAARQTRSSKDTGRRRAARAKRMANAPLAARAAAAGRLSTEQADALAAARTEANAAEFARREPELIEQAAGSLDDAVAAANGFRTETGESAGDRAARLWQRRSAACWDDEDGMTQGRQCLAGDGASAWRAAWDAFVDREHRNRDTEDRRTHAQKRADAAAELARFALAALRDEKPAAAERATINVLVRYEDLTDTHTEAWTGEDARTGQPLAGEAVRRLCCDADIVRMVTAGDSQIIDVGRKTRTIPVPTRRAVFARDGGCTFPGCHRRDGIQVHHLRFWTDLGRTDLENLACLCWHHHHLVHEDRWRLAFDPDSARTIWTAPDGRRLIGQRRATAGAKRPTAAA